MDVLFLSPGDLDERGQEVDDVSPAFLGPDEVGQVAELDQGRAEAATRAILLDLFVQFYLYKKMGKKLNI